MADVFVSHARSDKARVAPLVAAIEAKGWMNCARLTGPDNIDLRYDFACTLAAHWKDSDGAISISRP